MGGLDLHGMPKHRPPVVMFYPAWLTAVSWFGFALFAPSVPLLFIAGCAGLLAHGWAVGAVGLALALSLGYQVVRIAPVLLTMRMRVEVTADGIFVCRGKRQRQFVPWREFGKVREYHFASVKRYLDLQDKEIFAVFTNIRGLSALDDLRHLHRDSEQAP